MAAPVHGAVWLEALVLMLGVVEVVVGGRVDGVVGRPADIPVVAVVEAAPEAVPRNHQLRASSTHLVDDQLS